MSDLWISCRKPNAHALVRLFCFPYAGGSALIYRSWVDLLSPEIDVCPVQLPGRGNRLLEQPYNNIEALIDALVANLGPHLERPFACFGHSMGAVIAYELAHRLRCSQRQGPVHLLVSGRRAPQLPSRREPYYLLPDDELIKRLRKMNGTPAEVLANSELMALMLPLIRTDFELVETYPPSHHAPLACPITALGGTDDPEIDYQELEHWRQCTASDFRLEIFPGDHFFLHQSPPALLALIREQLRGV